MKYIAVFMASFLVLGGCASSSSSKSAKENQNAVYSAETEGIMDEEFDLLIAPEYDYETDIPYEVQIKSKQQAKKSAKKPAAKPKAIKQ
jgi:uncharacterized protein YceK